MAKEIAYAIITPYTIRKSRTGAVFARLLTRMSARLLATQMVALTEGMVERYAASITPGVDEQDERLRSLIRDYVRQNMGPGPDGRCHRALMLVFCGANARSEIAEVTGSLTISCDTGDTIRNAYGDLVWNADGSVRYFEPAVLISDVGADEREEIEMWLDFLRKQPALLEGICTYDHPEKVQQTLALIKPDSWRQQSSRPGTIIDMFSRTGLRIIGVKLCHMSVAQALEFYGPVKEALEEKLAPRTGRKARQILERELGVELPADCEKPLTEAVGIPYAGDQFEQIVEFMTGHRPGDCKPEEMDQPGEARTLGLVYEGEDAISKIRTVLGPTDPTKAPWGTIRREFGSDVMVNTAHASDSPENAAREIGILEMRESNLVERVQEELTSHSTGRIAST